MLLLLGMGLKLWVPLLALAILSISLVTTSAEESAIPSWIKTIAGFWSADQISDEEFIGALQYLVENDILIIPEKDAVTTTPPIVTQQPSTTVSDAKISLESMYLQATTYYVLATVMDDTGKPMPVTGDVSIKIFNFDG